MGFRGHFRGIMFPCFQKLRTPKLVAVLLVSIKILSQQAPFANQTTTMGTYIGGATEVVQTNPAFLHGRRTYPSHHREAASKTMKNLDMVDWNVSNAHNYSIEHPTSQGLSRTTHSIHPQRHSHPHLTERLPKASEGEPLTHWPLRHSVSPHRPSHLVPEQRNGLCTGPDEGDAVGLPRCVCVCVGVFSCRCCCHNQNTLAEMNAFQLLVLRLDERFFKM